RVLQCLPVAGSGVTQTAVDVTPYVEDGARRVAERRWLDSRAQLSPPGVSHEEEAEASAAPGRSLASLCFLPRKGELMRFHPVLATTAAPAAPATTAWVIMLALPPSR